MSALGTLGTDEYSVLPTPGTFVTGSSINECYWQLVDLCLEPCLHAAE